MANNANFWKLIPIVLGLAIGFLVFNPPEWLHFTGVFAYLVTALVAFGVLVGFIILLINKNLPADLALVPETQLNVAADLSGYVSELERLGFTPATSLPLRVDIAPPALLLPFVNEKERIYATVFKTGTIPSKVSYDMISILEGWRGGLTTGPAQGGGSLPAAAGSFRQIFPGAAISVLFTKHWEALAFLRSRGLQEKAITGSSFESDFKQSFARSRLHFLSSPVSFAIITLWRSATNRNPHIGPIQNQPAAQKEIEKLTTSIAR